MNTNLMIGVGVLLVLQLFAAIQVMRAAAERPDLTGMGRMMPVLLTLLVPVLGPLIGARATDAGTRPILISLVGTILCGVMAVLSGGPVTAPPPMQAAGQPAGQTAGQPATADAAAQPAADAKPAEAAQPAAAPAEAPKPAPAEQPAPTAEQPAVAATAPATTPEPAPAAVTPVAKTQAGRVAMPAMPLMDGAQPVVEVNTAPSADLLARPVRTEGQILITPTQAGGTMSYHISQTPYNNTRLQFAAAYVTPPARYDRAGHDAPPQLYLGGQVWSFNDRVDIFPPYLLADAEVVDGQTIQLPSVGGNYLAEVQFSGVEPAPDGHILRATIDVRIR